MPAWNRATIAAETLTREIFGNISGAGKAVFYVLAAVAVAVFALGIYRRVRLWRLGRRGGRINWKGACARLVRKVLLQREVLGRGLASAAHVLLFSGFVVLLIGTTLIAVEHVLADFLGREPTEPVFHRGVYFIIYEFTLDAFGLAFIAGVVLFAWRRWKRPGSIAQTVMDQVVLLAFAVIGVTGYLIEGLRIIREATPLAGVSFVGAAVAQGFEAFGVGVEGASRGHLFLWWFHAVLSLGVVAVFPYTRLLHALAGTFNWAARDREFGRLVPVTIEEVEETGKVGVGDVRDFTWTQLLELDACVSCGRCQDVCPAYEAGKPLSPRDVVQDARGNLEQAGKHLLRARRTGGDGDEAVSQAPALHGETIRAETLWACTTCAACVEVCPLGVAPLGHITDMRRFLVGEGQLRGAPAQALQKMQRSANPWGLAQSERFDWAEGLDVPTVVSEPDFEILYWVGCAASYDRRIQRVARSLVKLLKRAGVRFAVLGPEERCTGESARRMGEEFVFQELAMANVETLESHGVKRIVTHCPHCLNSLRQDYPDFGGEYEVVHHTQLLEELIAEGRLEPTQSNTSTTYHDPCYLARVQDETQAPRSLLARGEQPITELPRRGRDTACCGAGGGRMWFDDPPQERIGGGRVDEILAAGAETVAVACPFCHIMLRDGIAARDGNAEVKDIAEILAGDLES